MRHLIHNLVLTAGLALGFAGGTALADQHVGVTVQLETGQDGLEYLVDSEGKLLYIYKPSGTEKIPLAETWSEPSRTWARYWAPLLVSEPNGLRIGDGISSVNKLEVVEKVRNGTETYHVYWGGERTNSVPFWGLYTYKYDQPLEHYTMRDGDTPPGSVRSLWQPALVSGDGVPGPMNESLLLDPPGGPSGDKFSGGP